MEVTGTIKLDDDQFNEIREQIRQEEIANIQNPNELYISEIIQVITSCDISRVRNIVAGILEAEKNKIDEAKEDKDFCFHFSEEREFHQMEICLEILKMKG